MNILEVSNLSRHFGGLKAVEDISFNIKRGALFGIIGPNGAGKTTLFNLLTGFLEPTQGTVKFNNQIINGKKAHAIVNQGIARTFQLVKPFLDMTVYETLCVPRYSRHVSDLVKTKGEHYRLNRIQDVINDIGLQGKENTLVEDLNQGQLRLLDIARAILTEPELLFLDEPFSGLGHEHIEQLSAIINSLHAKGVTVVIIEHRLRELMKLVQHVLVINFGQKLTEGHPVEVVRNDAVIEAYLGKGKHFEPIES